MIDRALNYGRDTVREFLAGAAPIGRVLDLGAGKGADLLSAREVAPLAELVAIERHPSNAAALTAAGIQTHALDVERDQLPLGDESVDVVISNQILEHLKEVFWVFHEISRVLRVGGRAIIGVPNLASLHNRLLLAMGRQPTPIRTSSAHVRGYTKGDLLRFLDDCFAGGYAVRGHRGANFYPFPPLLARPMARMFPSLAWGLFLCVEKRRPYRREFLDYPVEHRLETSFFLGGAI